MPLDTEVARVIFLANLAERALHDVGPWEIAYGMITVPADREVRSDSVAFNADFPEVCWTVVPDPVLYLICRDDVVAAKRIEHPGDIGFEIEWSLLATSRASM